MRVVDLFAGWGGFSLGAEQAGCRLVFAANHWPLAVARHAAAFPEARHECQDLRQADWTSLPEYDLLLASPACQGHSTASQPRRRKYHDALRATAWAVIDCAEMTRPRAVLVENVLSFRRWALYRLWREALGVLGYHVTELVAHASHFGVPQRRSRLFVAATRAPLVFELPSETEVGFGQCLEVDDDGWRPISMAQPGARERMLLARLRWGSRRAFLSQHVTGHSGVPLEEPIRTITTKDHWVLVEGDRYRKLTLRELARGMGFPDSYELPRVARSTVIRGLGNAVSPPVARELVTQIARAC